MDPHVAHALAYPYLPTQTPTRIENGVPRPWNGAAEDVADRHAVLAVGSNASASVMAEKLDRNQTVGPVFMSPALVMDHDVVYSAHVSASGSIPATLWPSRGTTAWLTITWLNAAQCASIDRTEPNYDRLAIPARCLRGSPAASDAQAYISQHGALNIDGQPVALKEITTRQRRFKAMTQAQIQAHVNGDAAPAIARHIEDEAARHETSARLQADALTWRP